MVGTYEGFGVIVFTGSVVAVILLRCFIERISAVASDDFVSCENSVGRGAEEVVNGRRNLASDMQNAIPPHIAQSARNLFRECMRRADYVGMKQGNREALRALVRLQFRKNMHETDPIKIQDQKDAAVRGLFNHMFHEAERMADPLNRWTGIFD